MVVTRLQGSAEDGKSLACRRSRKVWWAQEGGATPREAGRLKSTRVGAEPASGSSVEREMEAGQCNPNSSGQGEAVFSSHTDWQWVVTQLLGSDPPQMPCAAD